MNQNLTQTFNCEVIDIIEQDEKLLVVVQGYSEDYNKEKGQGSSLGAGFYVAAEHVSDIKDGDMVQIDYNFDLNNNTAKPVIENGARFTPQNGQPFTAKIIR